ncbi:MAG: hypothetical protein QOC68_73, partial [Solirubrobacteraceae bacterium]|nr:hypothetical protein [Solirubrobacteraceae bacterium]
MADDPTPDGEGSARASRPAVRLGRKPTRLGAATRLGSEVAGARAPARVLRSATRLTAQPAPAPAADEPPSAPAAGPPPLPAAPTAAGDLPPGMAEWQAAWIFGGDAEQAIAMSELPGAAESGRAARLDRSRGSRIVEGPATGAPEPSPPASPSPSQEGSGGGESGALPPVPGASVKVGDQPGGAPRRSRIARAPAGSAQPAPPTPRSPEPPSIMRPSVPDAAPEPAAPGERPAPVRMVLRRKQPPPPPASPPRPRMQRGVRSEPVGPP